MSEDSITLVFMSPNLNNKNHKHRLEKCYKSHVQCHDNSNESSIEYSGEMATYHAAFCSLEINVISDLFISLEKLGVYDIILTAWYSNVGEEEYFLRKNNELLQFESKQDMYEHLRELEKKKPNISFNFEKSDRENTILIRLHIKSKNKREKLSNLFALALNNSDNAKYNEFIKGFNSLIKSRLRDIVWCKHKRKDISTWNEVCSDDLFFAVTDVIVSDEYLYIAFNIDKLPKSKAFKLDDYIWFIFSELDGVRKVWVKYRPINKPGHYLYYPGMGDESFFVYRDIQDDNEWPK